ncbi:hypothetical protein Tsubulata_006108, partial [Turnera subulata]
NLDRVSTHTQSQRKGEEGKRGDRGGVAYLVGTPQAQLLRTMPRHKPPARFRPHEHTKHRRQQPRIRRNNPKEKNPNGLIPQQQRRTEGKSKEAAKLTRRRRLLATTHRYCSPRPLAPVLVSRSRQRRWRFKRWRATAQ